MAAVSTVGEQLLQARESRHLTIEQVAEITKIRSDHLRALEEGNYAPFAAPVYIRGFVRTYSTLLKLDVPDIMATLETELTGQARQAVESSTGSKPAGGALDVVMLQLTKIDWRKAVLGLAGIALLAGIILGGLAWRHYHRADVLKDLKPGMIKSHRGAEPTLPLPAPKR
jgi:cytoskeletal protein RodZ